MEWTAHLPLVGGGGVSQLLCTILVLFPSYFLILMHSFVGHYGYPEYDLLSSRILVEAAALHSIDRF